jgi:Na+-transporting methylmalonyl-CoA/oxaloacetate decarboxylase gamma subunit
MRDVSTKQAALTVIGMTVVLAVVLYLATLFTA